MEPIKHNSKLWERKRDTGSSYWLFWCPACGCGHGILTPPWKLEQGGLDSPTFTPSLRLSYTDPDTKQETTRCHLNITAGQIVYHTDCPHEMKGKTILMQDLPVDYGF